MSFADKIEKHVERLGIAGTLAAFEAAGETLGRRTLEQWRAGREPRVIIQRGALAILDAASAAPKAPRPRKPRRNADP